MLHSRSMVIALWLSQLAFTLADINVVYKDIEYPVADEEYFSWIDAYLTENNAVTINTTIIKRLPEDATMHAVLLGNSMGEYVILSGVDVAMGMCEMVDEPIILGPLLGVLGFTADDCPPSPGVYGSEDYVVPEENFPEDFPANDYIFELEMMDGDHILLVIKISLEIQS